MFGADACKATRGTNMAFGLNQEMATEKQIAELIGRRLGIDFGQSKRRLDTWGQADRWVELRENLWLLLEIEGKQHHPNTNVLKLWPFFGVDPLSWTLQIAQ